MKTEILNYFSGKNIEIIYIFGSLARDELRDESDIDIALVCEMDFDTSIEYINDLEGILKKKVDLINFNKIDTIFQTEIITTGECIFSRDEYEKERLEMKILSEYLTLEEDRSIVLESVYERGSVFLNGKSNS